jgi:hypothetical protein
MRIRRLSPRTRTRFLASGLFLIGLSTTASLLAPEESLREQPGIQVVPAATLAADTNPTVQHSRNCPEAG